MTLDPLPRREGGPAGYDLKKVSAGSVQVQSVGPVLDRVDNAGIGITEPRESVLGCTGLSGLRFILYSAHAFDAFAGVVMSSFGFCWMSSQLNAYRLGNLPPLAKPP